jgi:hypothetical protein
VGQFLPKNPQRGRPYNAYIIRLYAMKSSQIKTVVQVPIVDVATEIATSHSINLPFLTAKIAAGSLVFEFGSGEVPASPSPDAETGSEGPMQASSTGSPTKGRQRRRTGHRNRMKTRGWGVVSKMTNSRGQTVTIYQPFVEALKDVKASRRDKERAVAQILRSNGNNPGRESVRYYLENTLDYLTRETSE